MNSKQKSHDCISLQIKAPCLQLYVYCVLLIGRRHKYTKHWPPSRKCMDPIHEQVPMYPAHGQQLELMQIFKALATGYDADLRV